MAQHPRQRQGEDAYAIEIDAGPEKLRLDPRPERAIPSGSMVAVVKAEKAEAVVGEEPRALVEPGEFVEVEKKIEDAVTQLMPPGPQAPVEDRAEIDARADRAHRESAPAPAGSRKGGASEMRPEGFSTFQGRLRPPSCSATASPACNPSS